MQSWNNWNNLLLIVEVKGKILTDRNFLMIYHLSMIDILTYRNDVHIWSWVTTEIIVELDIMIKWKVNTTEDWVY